MDDNLFVHMYVHTRRSQLWSLVFTGYEQFGVWFGQSIIYSPSALKNEVLGRPTLARAFEIYG